MSPSGTSAAAPVRNRRTFARPAVAAAAAACVLAACGLLGPHEPRHYLVITHSALDRVTFFDLDAQRVVGALPTQKLPHDMVLSPDGRSVYVVCAGAQNVTAYHLDSPATWRRARDFMRRDSTHARRAARPAAAARGGEVFLNPDPVQQLPAAVAEFHLTDPTFPDAPDSVRAAHARVRAQQHRACYDCHAGSHGGKPFGPVYTRDGRALELVHLAYRNVALLDPVTLAVRARIPLEVGPDYQPVEIWNQPGTDTALVTCRNRIGTTGRGCVLVVDLSTGHTVKTIPAGIFPWHLVPDPGGRHLLINNFQSSRISILDVARKEIVDSLVVQNGPAAMAWTPAGNRLLVSCFYTHRLLVVNPAAHAVERAIPVGSNPTSILFLADPRQVLLLCGGESDLEHINWKDGRVLERWPLVFGAYAFLLVDRDHSGRWLPPASGAPAPRLPAPGAPS